MIQVKICKETFFRKSANAVCNLAWEPSLLASDNIWNVVRKAVRNNYFHNIWNVVRKAVRDITSISS